MTSLLPDFYTRYKVLANEKTFTLTFKVFTICTASTWVEPPEGAASAASGGGR